MILTATHNNNLEPYAKEVLKELNNSSSIFSPDVFIANVKNLTHLRNFKLYMYRNNFLFRALVGGKEVDTIEPLLKACLSSSEQAPFVCMFVPVDGSNKTQFDKIFIAVIKQNKIRVARSITRTIKPGGVNNAFEFWSVWIPNHTDMVFWNTESREWQQFVGKAYETLVDRREHLFWQSNSIITPETDLIVSIAAPHDFNKIISNAWLYNILIPIKVSSSSISLTPSIINSAVSVELKTLKDVEDTLKSIGDDIYFMISYRINYHTTFFLRQRPLSKNHFLNLTKSFITEKAQNQDITIYGVELIRLENEAMMEIPFKFKLP